MTSVLGFLSAGGALWHETLPFLVGFSFVGIEIGCRRYRGRKPLCDAASVGYMLSEGISVCLMGIYGFALVFNPALATQIASKNSKVLAIAMFVAFATLVIHLLTRWQATHDA